MQCTVNNVYRQPCLPDTQWIDRDYRTSQLRKNLDSEAGPRYAGTKSSRRELFGNGDAAGDFNEDDDEEVDSEDDEDDDEEDDEAQDDDEEEDGGAFGEYQEDSDEEDDEDEDVPSDEEDDEMSTGAKPNGKQKTVNGLSNNNSHLDKESRDMIQELKKASSADIEKGREVRKQLVGLHFVAKVIPS